MNNYKLRNRSRVLVSGMLAAALVLGSGASALAAPAQNDASTPGNPATQSASTIPASQLIVALGDSITAGYEPGMAENAVPYGYVDRLKEQALFHGRAEVVNYGILGLKTSGLFNYVMAIKEGKAITAGDIQEGLRDPRLPEFASGISTAKTKLEQADVITITIGGNDVSALLTEAKGLTNDELKAKAAELLNTYKSNVQQVVSILTEINPNAQIILADQYQPVPKVAGAALYEELTKVSGSFTSTVDEMVSQFNADGKKVKAAHVAETFVGKELSLTHIFNEDVHPNQSGYEAIAKVMAQNIWGSYRETAAKSGGQTPISIVVKGKELSTPYAPVVKNGQTFVALKDITDAIGGQSRWDSKAGTATITYAGRTVVIPVGAKQITADGIKVDTAAPAFLHKVGKEQKTYVPLALLATGLGLDVQFSPKLKTAFINL